jgi:hypothetical protein
MRIKRFENIEAWQLVLELTLKACDQTNTGFIEYLLNYE